MGCSSAKSIETVKKRRPSLEVYSMLLVGERSGSIYNDYTVINPAIGRGAYGEVKKAIHRVTGLVRAVKIISKSSSPLELKKLKHEVDILKRLDHPNIIKVLEFYQDPRFFYIVTELCTGKELFHKIDDTPYFNEKMAAETMKQILSAIAYCHSHKIVHRDIKPENLVYENEQEGSLLKVIDFGASKSYATNQKFSQKLGTIYYMAPEIISGKYDEKCDIWSCGVILFTMLSGNTPFDGRNEMEIIEKIKKAKFSMDNYAWSKISDSAKHLVKRMLEEKPSNRISASEALILLG